MNRTGYAPSLFASERREPVAQEVNTNVTHSQGMVLAWLSSGDRTDHELAAYTGIQQNSIGKRRGECVEKGLVKASGRRRPAPSGSNATVWMLTEAGRDLALMLAVKRGSGTH